MKTLKMLSVLFFMAIAANAQDLKTSEVPQELKMQFEKTYANATDVEWEKEMDNYKVEFDIDRQEHEIWYTSSAKQVKLEKKIEISALPKAVSDAIKANYGDYKIDDCEMQEENGTVTYAVELEKWFNELEVVYSENGKLIKEIK